MIVILQWLLGLTLALIALIVISLYIRGAFRTPVRYKVKNGPAAGDQRFPIVLASLSNSFLSKGAVTDVWATHGQIQAARLEAIKQAEHTIYFETFYMTPGSRANDFAAAIAQQATAGVDVRLIVDAYGTRTLPKRYWKRLKAAGVQIIFFNPFDWRAPANVAGRTHRKLLLIDGDVGFVGGAGVSDEWDGDAQTPPWLDIELRLDGELVTFLEGQFMQHWTYGGGEADLQSEIFHRYPAKTPAPFVITAGNNPTYRFSPIRALKENTIRAAKERLWLSTPYLLPDQNSQDLLIEAKRRGVDVRLLTASADKIDKKYVYYAAFELFGDLLANGVEVYEYQPSMIHAKMLLVDDQWVNTGSANFDARSFFHNEELDLSTNNPFLIAEIEQVFQTAFTASTKVSHKDWKQRSWWRHKLIGRLVG
ncbi:MAG: phosphatidylserine/phosphatidylglycerophosphate/cardiolipin synthase family protein, partial [Thermosynechococcaceae cyanobacterium]